MKDEVTLPLLSFVALAMSSIFVGVCAPVGGYYGVIGEDQAPIVSRMQPIPETSGIPVEALEQTKREAEALRDAARGLAGER